MTTKAFTLADKTLKAIDAAQAEYQAERKRILADDRLSDQYKARLIAQARDFAHSQGYLAAANGWQSYQKDKQAAAAAVRDATLAKDKDIDPRYMSMKLEEYRSALRNAPTQADRLKVLNRIVDQAQYTPDTRRAAALAAADWLSSGDFALQATAARAKLREWSEQEDAPLVEAQRQAEAYDVVGPQFRERLLERESTLKGQPRYSGQISEWQKLILKEDAYSLGYIATTSDAQDYANMQGDAPAIPTGILTSNK